MSYIKPNPILMRLRGRFSVSETQIPTQPETETLTETETGTETNNSNSNSNSNSNNNVSSSVEFATLIVAIVANMVVSSDKFNDLLNLIESFIVGRRACDALETQFAPYRPLASSSSSSLPQILPGFLFNVGCEFVASCSRGMASICLSSLLQQAVGPHSHIHIHTSAEQSAR
ncbi:hypothetical protein AWZ03_009343 [Drosophila navojoa]|uniref:Uncharacterized protein n=1 Tax=Drosophila navojoa TaxID=7232 RepID=A0A484B630_DRONA|nr:hypothetical protein AWZ03_009343 [Drosophila navojoa]